MPIRFKKLRKILKTFDVWEDKSFGKGSHTTFLRKVDGSIFSYPVPTHDKDVKDCYINAIRKKFKLRSADGVSDTDFYGKA